MIEHAWTVVCTGAVIDKTSNNISLHNVIEQLTIAGTPPPDGETGVLPLNLDVVSFWWRPGDDPVQATGRVTIVSPSGDTINTSEYGINLETTARVRNITHLQGFPVRKPGYYRVQTEYRVVGEEWKAVASTPIQVVFRAPDD